MSTNVWKGFAPAVAEVHTVTVANTWANTDTATLTINGKSVTATVTGISGNATNATINAINTAWNASTIAEFAEITAARASNTTLTLTHDTAGVPFSVSATNVTAGDGTLAVARTTVAEGPSVANTASNWSLGANPVNTDDVVFQNSDRDCLYYLEAFSGLTFNSLTVEQTYTGDLGLPRQNGDDYVEYRPTYFKCKTNTIEVGAGTGTGSQRIKIDAGTANTTAHVYDTGSPVENGIPALLFKGTGSANVLNVLKGSVGVAFYEGESATVATLRVSYRTNPEGDADVICGDGCTLTTIEKTGGELSLESNCTTFTQLAGETTILGAATVTTLTVDGGTVYDRSSGTFTTPSVGPGATLDRSQDMRAKTYTNGLVMYKGSTFLDPFSTVNTTINTTGCAIQDVTLYRKPGKTYTES